MIYDGKPTLYSKYCNLFLKIYYLFYLVSVLLQVQLYELEGDMNSYFTRIYAYLFGILI